MGVTPEYTKRAIKNYNAKFDRIAVNLPIGTKERIKEMTGTSYTEYLIEYRLGKAAQELKITNDTVLEIAQRTGFENIANFNRLFKKRFGITPSLFRKQN